MLRTRGGIVILAFASVLLWDRVSSRAVPHHRRRGEGVGLLRNATLDRTTVSTVGRLGGELFMEGCQIEHFGPALFQLLNRTDCLTLRGGLIPSVTFHSHILDTLVIEATGLSTFEVDTSEVSYAKLRVLQITRNALERLPPGMSHLTGLRRLDLSQNHLTTVDLGVLGAMERLRDLDLSVNRISHLDGPADLRLVGLRNLWVSYNRLRSFAGFPGAFPVLDTVRLIGNAWSCPWVDRARADILRHGITAFGADYDCPGERRGGLCCEDDDSSPGREEASTTEGGWKAMNPIEGLTIQRSNGSAAPVGVRYGDVEIFL